MPPRVSFMPCDGRVLPDCPLKPCVEGGPEGALRGGEIIGISAAAQPCARQIGACDGPEPDMPAAAAERCEDAAGGVVCDHYPEIIFGAPGQMQRLINEDVRVEPVVHCEGQSHKVLAGTSFRASHSFSFVQRRRPETFFTAMATALAWPTMMTSFFPRVMRFWREMILVWREMILFSRERCLRWNQCHCRVSVRRPRCA